MKLEFSKANAPRYLAVFVIILGVIGLFAGDIKNNASKNIDNKELALIVESKVDHITVDDLADWLIQGRADFRLVDINEEKEFNDYHIPNAENIKMTSLLDGGLGKNEKIILYSTGGIHAAQAWMLLKANGYDNSYTILGGLDAWKDRILFPSLPAGSSAIDSINFEKLKAVSRYFGGSPQESASAAAPSTATLKRELPKLSSSGGGGSSAAPTKKKKKEGC